MNATQYDLVKRFLSMGNSASAISAGWHVPLDDVMRVDLTATFAQYKSGRGADPLTDFFSKFGL